MEGEKYQFIVKEDALEDAFVESLQLYQTDNRQTIHPSINLATILSCIGSRLENT